MLKLDGITALSPSIATPSKLGQFSLITIKIPSKDSNTHTIPIIVIYTDQMLKILVSKDYRKILNEPSLHLQSPMVAGHSLRMHHEINSYIAPSFKYKPNNYTHELELHSYCQFIGISKFIFEG